MGYGDGMSQKGETRRFVFSHESVRSAIFEMMQNGVKLENGSLWGFGQFWDNTGLMLVRYDDHPTRTRIITIYHDGPERVTLLKEWKIKARDCWAGDPMQRITNEINDWLYARFGETFSKREVSND